MRQKETFLGRRVTGEPPRLPSEKRLERGRERAEDSLSKSIRAPVNCREQEKEDPGREEGRGTLNKCPLTGKWMRGGSFLRFSGASTVLYQSCIKVSVEETGRNRLM